MKRYVVQARTFLSTGVVNPSEHIEAEKLTSAEIIDSYLFANGYAFRIKDQLDTSFLKQGDELYLHSFI